METLKTGDRVKIISAPIIENNDYAQNNVNQFVGQVGHISIIYKYGERRYYVSLPDKWYKSDYFTEENLEPVQLF